VCRARALLEIPLFGFCLGLLLAGLASALAICINRDERPTLSLHSAAAAMFRGRRERGGAFDSAIQEHAVQEHAIQEQWAANEFAFDRAVEAYEELIDSTCGRKSDARSCNDPRS
jgi:hypothetical protein